MRFLFLLLCVLSVATLIASPVLADKAPYQEQRREIQERIGTLHHRIAEGEKSHASTVAQLGAVESAIEESTQRIRQLSESRSRLLAEIVQFQDQARQLGQQTATQQDQLSSLLHHQFVREGWRDDDALRFLPADRRDPTTAGLDAHFLGLLLRAKAELIADLRKAATERRELENSLRRKNDQLVVIEESQRHERMTLLDQRRRHQSLLSRIGERIKVHQRELAVLQRDEKRLTRLIERLRQGAAKRPVPAIRDRARGKAPSAAGKIDAASSESGDGFPATKGGISRLPIQGEIIGRFGTSRPEGSATWKGLFIRASEGADVRAVASGQVVFSGRFPGFGELVIVSHGDDLLSVYGNNGARLRQTGESVKVGDVLATVGHHDDLGSGSYFELRYRGKAFDPLKWTGGKL